MFTLFLALLSLVAWEHIKPLFARCAACAALFVCAALLPYLCGNCRVALAWRAAQFGFAVSAIFRCVFSLLPMRLYDGTPGAGARVK